MAADSPLGILMLDTRFPRIVGDIGNAETFPFPVIYQTLEGLGPSDAVAAIGGVEVWRTGRGYPLTVEAVSSALLVDAFDVHGHDQAHLVAPVEPRVRRAEVPLSKLLDVFSTSRGGHRNHPPAHGEIVSGLRRIGHCHRDARIAAQILRLLEFVGSVENDVPAVCVDPDLTELWRAIGHERRHVCGTGPSQERDQLRR